MLRGRSFDLGSGSVRARTERGGATRLGRMGPRRPRGDDLWVGAEDSRAAGVRRAPVRPTARTPPGGRGASCHGGVGERGDPRRGPPEGDASSEGTGMPDAARDDARRFGDPFVAEDDVHDRPPCPFVLRLIVPRDDVDEIAARRGQSEVRDLARSWRSERSRARWPVAVIVDRRGFDPAEGGILARAFRWLPESGDRSTACSGLTGRARGSRSRRGEGRREGESTSDLDR